jgi:N-acetylmuramoyl-L-alanine amidase
MSCRFIERLLALFLVLVFAPSAWSATVLRKIVLAAPTVQSAQLTLSLSGLSAQKLMTLDHPDRVVIDLPATRMAPGVRLPAALGPVVSLRTGVQGRQGLRIVLQLKSSLSAKLHVQEGTGGSRELVVEVGNTESARVPVDPVPVRPAHAPQDSGRDVMVVIDAGHGGQDPGAMGRSRTREKDVVLAIARALAQRVNAEPGMRAQLTRNDDRFVALRERINLARAAKADLFVSIHADSIANREVSGSSVYVLSDRGASSEAARWLAENENAADLKGGVSLGDKSDQLASVLMDLSQTASIGASMEAAERVLGALDQVGTVRKSKVQQAGFVVLKSPDIPSMLIETAYISNPEEERRLRSASYQNDLAEAICKGLREHFRRNPPDGSLFARQQKSHGLNTVIAGSTP